MTTTATHQEVITALEQITPAQWQYLRRGARQLSFTCCAAISRAQLEEDLLQEAVARTLAGAATGAGRLWYQREGNTILVHLCGVMMSLANWENHSWWQQIQKNSVCPDAIAHPGAKAPLELISNEPGPDAHQYNQELLALIWVALEGDEAARAIVASRLDGATEAETRRERNLSERRFDSARKRITRKRVIIGNRMKHAACAAQ